MVVAVLYAMPGRRLVAEVPMDVDRLGQVLVSDSGYIVSAGSRGGGCTYRASAGDPLITVYRADGSRAGALNYDDVFNSYDVMQLESNLQFELRQDVVVVSLPRLKSVVERRVDLATAQLLDQKSDIYPRPRVYATAIDSRAPRPYEAVACAALFRHPEIVRLDSAEIFRRATVGPLPELPEFVMKARIRGTVSVELVVSERGDVLCARGSYFPFRVTEVTTEAAWGWRFSPLHVNGRAARFAGELLFHFEDLDEQTWLARVRGAPPAR